MAALSRAAAVKWQEMQTSPAQEPGGFEDILRGDAHSSDPGTFEVFGDKVSTPMAPCRAAASSGANSQ